MDHQQDEVLELLDAFRTIRNTLALDTAYIAKLIAAAPAEERSSLRTTLQLTDERISEYAAIIQYLETGVALRLKLRFVMSLFSKRS